MITFTVPVVLFLVIAMGALWVLFILSDVFDKRWLRNATFVATMVVLLITTVAIAGLTGAES